MNTGLSIGSLFLEGLLSFFSPCVLPLVPLYIGYLTADARKEDENGNVTYARGRTLAMTISFILGISMVFILAGLGSGILHDFFSAYTIQFEIAGSVLLVIFGLFSLQVIQIPFLAQTHAFTVKQNGPMGLVRAWLMGFFFSFAWSPCIGPMLAQAIVLAASAENKAAGWLDIAAYAAGFLLIFLLLGLFTTEILNLLKKHRGIVKYTGILSGIVVLCMGVYMLYQANAGICALQKRTDSSETAEETETEESETSATVGINEMNFTLKDAEGQEHSLTDYKGKTILLNFFGTWCYYCNQELPGLQEIQDTRTDVQILLIAAPGVNNEGTIEEVEAYMKDAGYSMEILYDETLEVTEMYSISGYPTSFIIKPDGSFLGYIPGYIDEDSLNDLLDQAAEE